MVTITKVQVGLIIALMLSLGVNVIDTDQGYIPYGCDKETVDDILCYKLSRVNDAGIQRNCYYDRDASRKYKVCSTGWERLDVEDTRVGDCTKVQVLAYTDQGKWFCEGIGPDMDCINGDMVIKNFCDIE